MNKKNVAFCIRRGGEQRVALMPMQTNPNSGLPDPSGNNNDVRQAGQLGFGSSMW
jgi:hypothetical protein